MQGRGTPLPGPLPIRASRGEGDGSVVPGGGALGTGTPYQLRSGLTSGSIWSRFPISLAPGFSRVLERVN